MKSLLNLANAGMIPSDKMKANRKDDNKMFKGSENAYLRACVVTLEAFFF